MRDIVTGVIHCSATKEGVWVDETMIESWHKKRFKKIGGKHIGYHILIYLDGTVVQTKGLEHVGQHVAGANSKTVGICLIGGLDVNGTSKNTFTRAQMVSLEKVIRELRISYPKITFKGHRDYSPDLNGNGVIEPFEFLKDCPCFDVASWMKSLNL